jgi:hypothetical protein
LQSPKQFSFLCYNSSAMLMPFHSRVFLTRRWLLPAALLLCALAYLPSLVGEFLFDDFPVVVDNPALRGLDGTAYHWLVLALSSSAGVLRRPLSMLSLGLDYSLFGLHPYAFKLTNLAIHLANGALVYALARRLVPRLFPASDASPTSAINTVPLFVTALWLLHPLHVSSVAYVVQRMNLLAGLFTLAGLVCYAEGRDRMQRGDRGAVVAIFGLCAFGLLATLSKENGALIAAYALVIEVICYRFEAAIRTERRLIQTFSALSVALPLLLFAAYLTLHPGWLSASYAARDFTLTERLLSESRILCDYLLWIFVPLPAWMGFFHDDIATSTGLFAPVSTIVAITFLAALLLAAWKLRRRSPGFAFAVAWFFVGHAMESTLLPLELVFEHRNYLPMSGLLLGTVCAIVPLVRPRLTRTAIGVSIALLLGMTALTATRAASWGEPFRLAFDDARHHPDSARSQYEAGRAVIIAGTKRNERAEAEQQAIPYLERAAALDKSGVFPPTTLILIRAASGPVPPADIADLAERLRKTRHYTQANAFFYMLNTSAEGKLSLTRQDFDTLVEAALSNPRFPPAVRATILHDFGRYLFLVPHDNQGAVSLLLAATAEDPNNPYFEITLTRVALRLKQPDIARLHLQAAERLDRAGYYASEIAALRQQLASGEGL